MAAAAAKERDRTKGMCAFSAKRSTGGRRERLQCAFKKPLLFLLSLSLLSFLPFTSLITSQLFPRDFFPCSVRPPFLLPDLSRWSSPSLPPSHHWITACVAPPSNNAVP